jgi:hypothetical protein
VRANTPNTGRIALWALAALILLGAAGCAGLTRLLGVEAPRFESAPGREHTLSLDPLTLLSGNPLATLTVWARVTNPNSFGLTVSTLQGDVVLEGRALAAFDLPLGVPLLAARDTVIPLRIRFGLPALSALEGLGTALLSGGTVAYRLDGVLGVDAGALGTPSFGPRTWLAGEVDVLRGIDVAGRR